MTPPPAESVAAMIRPAPTSPDSRVNRDLLRVMEGTSIGYWALVLIAAGFATMVASAVRHWRSSRRMTGE